MKCRIYKCKACCCYNVPFDKGELEQFADKIVTPVLSVWPVGPAVVPFTVDFKQPQDIMKNKCPFLRSDFQCNIYNDRPDVCRKFGQIKELPCRFIKI